MIIIVLINDVIVIIVVVVFRASPQVTAAASEYFPICKRLEVARQARDTHPLVFWSVLVHLIGLGIEDWSCVDSRCRLYCYCSCFFYRGRGDGTGNLRLGS